MGDSTPAEPAVPSPTAPPGSNNAASLAVEQATYRQQLRRKNIASTIHAGANGGLGKGMTPSSGQTAAK